MAGLLMPVNLKRQLGAEANAAAGYAWRGAAAIVSATARQLDRAEHLAGVPVIGLLRAFTIRRAPFPAHEADDHDVYLPVIYLVSG
jgi:hypothetical protein